ncbi:hypothetical protein ACFQJ5_00350 [Halomicroarcula sp. GCM10025324]|uniref:DUF7835 family putative zinc beta-ribbon protein n=1 Tax=Haloarcula TaxID=2237 RepID=UPI0023E8DD04|nr:hypothetical protein [Halomicroarcula sp. ZS-22-S1]
MATTKQDVDHEEGCTACESETPHAVSVEILTESPDVESETAAFSREPYRVSTCLVCGTTTTTRMNNA